MISLTPKKLPTHLDTYNLYRRSLGLRPVTEEEALTAWTRGRPYRYDPLGAIRLAQAEKAQAREDAVLAALDDTDPMIRMLLTQPKEN